ASQRDDARGAGAARDAAGDRPAQRGAPADAEWTRAAVRRRWGFEVWEGGMKWLQPGQELRFEGHDDVAPRTRACRRGTARERGLYNVVDFSEANARKCARGDFRSPLLERDKLPMKPPGTRQGSSAT